MHFECEGKLPGSIQDARFQTTENGFSLHFYEEIFQQLTIAFILWSHYCEGPSHIEPSQLIYCEGPDLRTLTGSTPMARTVTVAVFHPDRSASPSPVHHHRATISTTFAAVEIGLSIYRHQRVSCHLEVFGNRFLIPFPSHSHVAIPTPIPIPRIIDYHSHSLPMPKSNSRSVPKNSHIS